MSNIEGSIEIRKVSNFVTIVVVLSCIVVGPGRVSCQNNNAAVQIFAQELYNSMKSYTSVFKSAIKKELGFCIVDV